MTEHKINKSNMYEAIRKASHGDFRELKDLCNLRGNFPKDRKVYLSKVLRGEFIHNTFSLDENIIIGYGQASVGDVWSHGLENLKTKNIIDCGTSFHGLMCVLDSDNHIYILHEPLSKIQFLMELIAKSNYNDIYAYCYKSGIIEGIPKNVISYPTTNQIAVTTIDMIFCEWKPTITGKIYQLHGKNSSDDIDPVKGSQITTSPIEKYGLGPDKSIRVVTRSGSIYVIKFPM